MISQRIICPKLCMILLILRLLIGMININGIECAWKPEEVKLKCPKVKEITNFNIPEVRIKLKNKFLTICN